MLKARNVLVWFVALVDLGSGVANVLSVMHPHFPPHGALFAEVFPLEFFHLSRFLTLLLGFGLVIVAPNLIKRKRRAFVAACILTLVAVPFHLAQGLDYRGALASTALLVLLAVTRRNFTVRSGSPDLGSALRILAGAAVIAFAYGVAGFWLLDRRHFDVNFHLADSIRGTFIYLTYGSDAELIPRTRYARWFIDSLYLTTSAALIYSFISLFRPVLHRFRTLPREQNLARALVARFGRSSLDYFKCWRDKSYFFSASGDAFLAYRVGGKHAIVLGDPVGPAEEIGTVIAEFKQLCIENDWVLAFHQALPDWLPIYARQGFRKLKIGDEAVVDLTTFSLEGRQRREFRNTVQRLEKQGIDVARHDPPIPDHVLERAREVSDEWLRLPGRRERQFTLGMFDPDYVRSTPLLLASEKGGRALAFMNQVPSYVPGEATIDLMRRRIDVPNGIMDYLFIKLFEDLKASGFTRFSLGMAPMSGFREREEAAAEERAIHFFFRHMNFLFSYSGLRAYKAKFASSWEPRYLIYQRPLDLPAVAIALGRVSEIRRGRRSRDGD